MNKQQLKTSDTDVLSSRKKLRKTLRGEGGGIQPPSPLERPRVKYSQNQEVSKSDPSEIGFSIT